MANKINESKLERETDQWTGTWTVIASDPPVGKKILHAMHAFVSGLTGQRLPYTAINRHVLNLWLLCGEIVRYVQNNQELKSLSSYELILRFVDAEGGPHCSQLATQQQQRSFDATCKKLFQHLTMPPKKD